MCHSSSITAAGQKSFRLIATERRVSVFRRRAADAAIGYTAGVSQWKKGTDLNAELLTHCVARS